MIRGQSMLPILSTNNINISSGREKIEVDFSLSIVSNRGIMQSLIESGVAERLFLYFIVFQDDNFNLINSLSFPETRNDVLKLIAYQNMGQLIQRKAIKRFRLDDIINDNLNESHTRGDLFNHVGNELRAKIILNYSPGVDYRLVETDKLHLVCFMHTDFDSNLLPPRPIFAGNLNYDLLLQRSGGELQVPDFLNLFYVDSSQVVSGSVMPNSGLDLYTGPVHYHGPQNPAADGYIGWMAGHPNGDMGPKLQVRQVRNDKVFSDFSNSYMNFEFAGPTRSASTQSMLSTDINHASNLREIEILKKQTDAYYLQHQTANPAVLEYGDNYTSFTTVFREDPGSNLVSDRSHHGFAFGVKFIEILKYRTRLGYLLDYHLEMQNDRFVLDALGSSKIADLKIIRRRVESRPLGFNETEGPKYNPHTEDQISSKIIESSDESGNLRFKHNLHTMRSVKGEIREVELFTPPTGQGDSTPLAPPYNIRQFIVKDYDLFHNINFGKYEYLISLEIEDGVFKVVEKTATQLRRLMNRYQRLLLRAEIPINKNYSPEEEQVNPGNYDYTQQKFTDNFATNQSNINILSEALEVYTNVKTVLFGRVDNEEISSLENYLSLPNTSLQDLVEFGKVLADYYHLLRSLLTQDDKDEFASHGKQRISTVFSKRGLSNIKIVSKIGVHKEALSPETPVADYSLGESNSSIPVPYNTYVNILRNDTGTYEFPLVLNTENQSLTTFPNRFVQIFTSPRAIDVDASPYIEDKERRMYEDTIHPKPGPSEIKELTTIKEYSTQSRIEKQNLDLKLSVMTSKGKNEVLEYETNGQSDHEWPLIAQKFSAGISIGFSKRELSITQPSNLIELVNFEELKVDIPDETKKSLCESAYIEPDKEHFINKAESSYKELFASRQVLGQIYDYINHLSLFSHEYSTDNIHNQSFEAKYKDFKSQKSLPNISSVKGIYTRNARSLEIVSPGHEPVPVKKLSLITAGPPAPPYVERCMFVKYTSYNDDTAARPVNNFVFLEI